MSTIRLRGQLTCRDEQEAAVVTEHLPRHVELTRAEPGCRSFEVTRSGNPLVWDVVEEFEDEAAYREHQERAGRSAWGRATRAIAREYRIEGL